MKLLVVLDPLLRQIRAPYWLDKLDPSTWRRWRAGSKTPEPASLMEVGGPIWDAFRTTKGSTVWQEALNRILEIEPTAAQQTWVTQESTDSNNDAHRIFFCEWLSRIDEKKSRKTSDTPVVSPLTTTLELHARNPKTGHLVLVTDQPDILPIKPADELRIVATCSRPAWVCLVWINQHGKPQLMNDWPPLPKQTPNASGPIGPLQTLLVPRSLTSSGRSALTVHGRRGIETLVFLAAPDKFSFQQSDILGGRKAMVVPPIEIQTIRTTSYAGPGPAHLPGSGTRGPAHLEHDEPLQAFHDTIARTLISKCHSISLLSFQNAGESSRF